MARSFKPPSQPTEATVVWDVSDPIDTPAEVNALKLVVRNDTTNGKKALLDRVLVTVTYADQPPAPTAPTITSSPGTSAFVGQPYGYQGQATGSAPITWSLPTAPIGMAVTDGYDSKSAKTLVADGKLSVVQSSDDNRVQVEGGRWLSMQFGPALPATATVQSVKVSIEGVDEAGLPAGAVRWQVGGGTLSAPTMLRSEQPATRTTETTVVWDVSDPIDTPAELNALKVVVRNDATNGKKTSLDRVFVQAGYLEQPVAPAITSSPPTAATVDQPYRYTLAVSTAPAEAIMLAAGDVADCNSAGDDATATLLDQNPIGTIAALGDLAYESGTAAEFANCYQPTWGRHKARTRPAPGNHEYNTPNATPY